MVKKGASIHPVKLRHFQQLWDKLIHLDPLPQLDKWLVNYFRQYKGYGSKDRQWYGDAVFSIMRVAPVLAYFFDEKVRAGEYPPANNIDSKQIWQTLRSQSSSELLKYALAILDLHGVRPNNILAENSDEFFIKTDNIRSVLLSWKHQVNSPEYFLSYGFPPALLPQLKKRLALSWNTESLSDFLSHQLSRPPLFLRVRSNSDLDFVCRDLSQSGISFKHIQDTLCLQITEGKNITTLPCYTKGLVEIQDYASQQISSAVACKKGQFVWDACAGGGGKTMHIAAQLGGTGIIFASDNREYKFSEIAKRALRGGFKNIRTLAWQGDHLPEFPLEVTDHGGFDWILIDAPCSGSGTWRRNPDLKLRFDFNSIEKLRNLQYQLLEHASNSLKNNGHLVYASCSWLLEENEELVDLFLQRQSSFKLKKMALVGSPNEDADTMFFAVLQKMVHPANNRFTQPQ